MKTHLDDLSPALRKKALEKFDSLANAQRGEPEEMGAGGPMRANPGIYNATGVWTWLSEHVGDITHRIAAAHHVDIHYGIDMAEPKVRVALRTLKNKYGCEKEIEQNLLSNHKYNQEQYGETKSFDEWKKEFIHAANNYANAHRKLVVYNYVQALARDAAIAIGDLDYKKATFFLDTLYNIMESDNWLKEAGTVFVENGNIVEYA